MKTQQVLPLLFLVPSLLIADQPRVGSTTGQVLRLDTSARAAAVGGAFLALADDASAVFYNPAGLVRSEGKQVFLSHRILPADVAYEVGAFSMPLSETQTLAVSFAGLYTDEMKVTTPHNPEGTGETFVYSTFHTGLAYSRWMTDKFSFGVGARYLRINFMNTTYSIDTWSGYLGSLYDIGYRDTRFGVVIGNFGPDIEAISESYGQPLYISLGVLTKGYVSGVHNLDIIAVASKPRDTTEQYSLGAEYWYSERLALRAGYRFQHDSLSWAGGAGFLVGSESLRFRLDYAFCDMDLLGGNHQFSIVAVF